MKTKKNQLRHFPTVNLKCSRKKLLLLFPQTLFQKPICLCHRTQSFSLFILPLDKRLRFYGKIKLLFFKSTKSRFFHIPVHSLAKHVLVKLKSLVESFTFCMFQFDSETHISFISPQQQQGKCLIVCGFITNLLSHVT